jgi:hypothetical protein
MNETMIEKIALLVVGWLFGLLGPAIVDANRRRRENRLGQRAILSELRELGNKLALAAYGVRIHQGTVDRAFVEWIKRDFEQHATSSELQEFIPRLRQMLSFTDQQIQEMNQHSAATPARGLMLQRLTAPLLDSRVSAMWSFETSFQRQLLEIRQQLALLDDLVDRSRKYFDLTFGKLEESNYDLVKDNFHQACDLYARGAERVVRLIRAIEPS